MEDETYIYKGVEFSRQELEDKYGDRTDEAIEKHFQVKKKELQQATSPVFTEPSETPLEGIDLKAQQSISIGKVFEEIDRIKARRERQEEYNEKVVAGGEQSAMFKYDPDMSEEEYQKMSNLLTGTGGSPKQIEEDRRLYNQQGVFRKTGAQIEREDYTPEVLSYVNENYRKATGDNRNLVFINEDDEIVYDDDAIIKLTLESDEADKWFSETVKRETQRKEKEGALGRTYEALSDATKTLLNGINIFSSEEEDNRKAFFRNLSNQASLNAQLADIEFNKPYSELTQDELNEIDKLKAKGVSENIKEGNVDAGLAMGYNSVLANAPQIGLMIASSRLRVPTPLKPIAAGLRGTKAGNVAKNVLGAARASKMANYKLPVGSALLGLSAAGQKYNQIYDNPHLTDSEKMFMAVETGVVELALEAAGAGVERRFASALRGFGRKAATDGTVKAIKSASTRQLTNSLKSIPKGILTEAAEEALAGLNEVALDRIFLDKDTFNPYEILDQGIIGGAFGGGMSIAGTMLKLPSYIGSVKNSGKRAKLLRQIAEDRTLVLSGSLEEDATRDIQDRIQRNIDKVLEMDAMDAEKYSNFSEDDVLETIKLNEEISLIRDNINQENEKTNPSPERVDALKEKLVEANKQREEIEAKYAVEAKPDTETGGAVQLDEETQGELDDVMRDADFTVSEQEAPTRASKTEAYADEDVQGGIINLIKTKGGELGREFVGAIERIKSTLGEGYKVVVLDEARYRDVTNTTGRGAFDTKNKVLYLNAQQVRNLDKDNVRAVYHEAIHPILTKRFGEASADFVTFKQDLVNAINRSLSGQDAATLIARLEAFEAQYGDKTTEQQAEEFMTELGAIMASEDVELLRKSGLLNRIKELINNLLRKLGVDISLDTENDVVEFMNSLAQGVRGGVAVEQIVPESKKSDKPRVDEETFLQESRAIINEQFLSEEKQVIKFRKAGVDNKQTQQAINDIGLKGVKFKKEGIEEAIQKAFDDLVARAESFVMTEDSKAITGAIMADIEAMRADGASESEVAYAERGLEEGSPVRGEYMRKFQDAQRNEIRNWVSYLNQSDYNTSFKYLILDGVLTNNYDKKRNKYVKRDRKTLRSVTPFNAASLAELYQSDSKEMLKDYTDIQEKNAIALAKSRQVATTTEGEWIKYDGGRDVSNEDIAKNASELAGLVSDTPWCTKTNAASQLRGGDFYVYATKGEDGSMIPRIAIRMEGDQVSEVRGVASEKQDLEPSMNPVADKFLKENIPNDSGQKWLDSIEYNEKAEQLLQDINEKGLNRARMVSYFELLPDENKYTQDYGRNGHIERLEAKIEELVENYELARDLKGKVILSKETAQVTDRGYLGAFGDAEFFIGNLILPKGDSDLDIQYVSGNVRVIGDVTNIKFVGGNLGITDGNPISVEEVGRDVDIDRGLKRRINAREKGIDDAITLGNLRKVGRSLFTSNLKDLGNLEEVGDMLNISGSNIKSLGNKIKSVGDLVVMGKDTSEAALRTDDAPLEDFGSLEKVEYIYLSANNLTKTIQPTQNNIRFIENNREAFNDTINNKGRTGDPKYDSYYDRGQDIRLGIAEDAFDRDIAEKATPSDFYIQYLKDKAGEPPIQESRNLAPNGQPSNLNDEQYKIVRTPEFKNWFGDWENDPANASKVVDENGEPLVVYHGSPAIDIESFDRSKSKKVSSGLKMFGTYFSTNPELAEIYASAPQTEEYKREIKSKIESLQSDLKKAPSGERYDAIDEEIDRLEELLYFRRGEVYPVFLSMRDMVTFDAKGKQFNEGAWRQIEADAGYKIAKGIDAIELYAGYNTMVGDKQLKDGVKAENIIEGDIVTIDEDGKRIDESLIESEKQRLIGDAFLVFDHVKNYAKLADGSNRTFDPEKEGLKESRNFDRKTEKAMEGVFYQPKIDERFNKASKRQMANKKLFDRQGIIRRALQDANDLITQAALSVRNGSSAAAKKMYERFNKNIFLNVAGKKKLGLNEIIMLRRIISIYDGFDRGIDTFQQEIKDLEAKKKRTKKETARLEAVKKQLADLQAKKANFKNPQKLNRESALARLDEIKQKMRDETGNDQQFFDMDNRASRFFTAMREILKRKLDEGLITQDEYFRLSKHEYSPRMFVDKVFDLQNGDFAKHEKRFMGYGLSEKEFKKLKEGSEEDLFTEGDFLLRMVVAASESRVFANRLFKQLGKKVDSYEWLSDTKKNGFSELTYKEDGESRSIYVRNDIAEEIENADSAIEAGLGKVGKYFGTNILRAMATGYNPLFPLSNIPMDFANVVMFTDTYDDKSLVRAMIELSKDFSKNLAGIGTITAAFRGTTKADPEVLKNLEEAFEAGIGMDFLTNQGRVKFKTVEGSKLERIGQTFGDFMSSFGENSELAMRLSVYNKVKADSLKKRKDGDAQFKDMNDAEIRAYAAFKARATIDFSQGGSLAKSLDKMSPYFNASLQGLRVAGNYIRTNPAKFGKKFGEGALYAIAMSFAMQHLFEMFGWDDDDKEAIPEYHRRNYFIIPLPFTDDDGNKKYIKIRKLPQLAPMLGLFDLVGEATYRSLNGESEKNNKEFYTKGLVDFENTLKAATVFGDMVLEFDEEGKPSIDLRGTIQYSPPVAKAMGQYITNYDFFRERNISYEKLYNQASPEFEGKFDDNVEEFYKEFGELTGMSPKRTKNAVEVVTTSPSTNLMVGVGYGIANAIMTGDKSFKDVTRGMEKRAVGTANKKYIKRKPSAELNKLLQEYKDNQFVVRKELTKMVVEDNAPKKDVIQYVNGIDDKKLREYAIKKYKKLQRKNKFDDLVLDRKSVYYNLDDYMSEKPELAAEYLFNEFGSLTNQELREVASYISMIRGTRSFSYPPAFMRKYRELQK